MNPEDVPLPDWTGALCAGCDPDLWFPVKGGSGIEAKRICWRCPIQQQCLNYALDNYEKFGVWGGATERERRAMRRHLRVVPS